MSIGKAWIQADDKTKVRQVDPKSACPENANDQGGYNSSNSFQRMLATVQMIPSYAHHGKQARGVDSFD